MRYELHNAQANFFFSRKRHAGLIGGYGSGKSFAGILKTVAKKMEYPNVDVAYYLPTYSLISDMAFGRFEEIMSNQNLPYNLNESKKTFHTPYGKIILRSMDNPNLIVSYEVGYSLIDEADVIGMHKMKYAFHKIVARNRTPLPDGTDNCTDFVSTPEGFGFLYEFFVKGANENREYFKAKTIDNIKYLPSGYIETLQEIYSGAQLEAYLNGEFVNLHAHTVFHQFDREANHSNEEILPRDVLHVGMDFNVTNMSAVVHVSRGKEIHAVEEISKAFDTDEMIQILQDRYKGHRVVVYPDASGANRRTTGESDVQLLKKAGFMVKMDKSNPLVKDRITLTNAGFKNKEYFVNTYSCPDYTESLEKLPYDKHGQPDKNSGFDHMTDAGTYCFYQLKRKKVSYAGSSRQRVSYSRG